MKVRKVYNDADIITCAEIIRNSFITVADAFGLTIKNAPTNPAFITAEDLQKSIEKGLDLYLKYLADEAVGCIGIQMSKSSKEAYYIERLSVLPEKRHLGIGKSLLDFACAEINKKGGKEISIGIINENKILKEWYIEYGFIEKAIRIYEHLPFTVCLMTKNI
jgi:ribosomal protein S18 acetylase RimI-like enzyme